MAMATTKRVPFACTTMALCLVLYNILLPSHYIIISRSWVEVAEIAVLRRGSFERTTTATTQITSAIHETTANRMELAARHYESKNLIHSTLKNETHGSTRQSNFEHTTETTHTCRDHDGRMITIPRVPHFIIAGTMKGGTTALRELLSKHPDLETTTQAESHFFDYKGELKPLENMTQADLCSARARYAANWIHLNGTDYNSHDDDVPRKITFEKTPSYMVLPKIPALVHAVCPWKPKIILSLRNPIDRAFSHYVMIKGRKQDYMTFEEMIHREVLRLRSLGLSQAPTLREFVQARNIKNNDNSWMAMKKQFDLPVGLSREQRNRVSTITHRTAIARGFYAQQIRNWMDHFELDQDLLVISWETFKDQPALVLNQILDFVGAERADYPPGMLRVDYRPNGRFTSREQMQPLTREYLEHLYRPYNEELVALLGEEELPWQNVWH